MAVTMIVLYREPPNREQFDTYYSGTHIPLVQKMPGLFKVEVQRFTGREAPFYLMATLYFNDKDERKASMNSPEGQAASADVANFAAPGTYAIAFADVI